MGFTSIEKRGLARFLVDDSLPADRLSIHRTIVQPHGSSHAPHTHDGIEAFLIVRGTATVDCDGETSILGPSEAMVVDCSRPHGIRNETDAELEYLVVISK